MKPKPPTCEGCPAHKLGTSYVPGVGPATPKVVVLGQGPGRYEATFGSPFCGPAGAKLDRWLERSTPWHRDELWIDNVVRCWLPKDRPPTAREVAHCRAAHWEAPLMERLATRTLDDGTSAVLILTLGSAATKALLGPQAGEAWNGSLERTTLTLETTTCK